MIIHLWAKNLILYALGLITVVLGLQLMQGDITTRANGYGGDGINYGVWAEDFPAAARAGKIYGMYTSRFFPSLFIYTVMKALGIDGNQPNVLRAFLLLNFTVLFLSFLLFLSIAKELGLSKKQTGIGALFAFSNFAVFKWAFYNPVLLDSFALFLGFISLWAYLRQIKWLLLLLFIVASLSWPHALPPLVFMILFNSKSCADFFADFSWKKIHIFPIVLAISILFGIHQYSLHYKFKMYAQGVFHIMLEYYNISMVFVAIYIYLMTAPLLNVRWKYLFSHFYKRFNLWGLLTLPLSYGLVTYLKTWMSPESSGNADLTANILHNFHLVFMSSVVTPLKFLSSHVFFLGGGIVLIFLFWQSLVHRAKEFGLPMIGTLFIFSIHSISTETRHLVFYYAFVVCFATLAAKEPLQRLKAWLVAPLLLIFSRFWLPIGGGPFERDPSQWLDQKFYMQMGPYTSHQMYWWQLLSALVFTTILFLLIRRKNAF